MCAFHDALVQLAALSVSGVRHHYGIDAIPDELSRAQLPALLVMPLSQERQLFPERGEGYKTLAFSDGARTVSCAVTHLLLVTPITQGHGLRSQLPLLVDLIDAYFAALHTSITLNGTLTQPPHVRVEPGEFTHGTTRYIGCAFRHLWTIEVS